MTDLIGFVVFGLVVGLVARLLVPGKQQLGIGTTVVLGVIGSLVGAVIASALGTGDIFELDFLGAVVAIGTSVVLVVVGERTGIIRRKFGRND